MNKLVDLIDRLNLWVGKLIAWLVVVLVLLIVVDVVLRYLFNFGSVANAEMELVKLRQVKARDSVSPVSEITSSLKLKSRQISHS